METKNQYVFDTFTECLWKTGQEHLASGIFNNLSDRVYAAELLKACQTQDQDANPAQEQDITKFVLMSILLDSI